MQPGLDSTAIAEALWLATVCPPSGRRAESEEPGTGRPRRQSGLTNIADRRRHRLHPATREPSVASSRVPGWEVGLPGVGTRLRGPELARALRPFKRSWPNGRRLRLDIAATVDGYARSGELLPVFRPGPERWFDVAVVTDTSTTMTIWHETCGEFLRLLRRVGAFRTLTTWTLDTTQAIPVLRNAQARYATPSRLLASDRRRLVIILSDCQAPAWQSGRAWATVRDWARAMPTAMLNPLPLSLWRHTGLELFGTTALSPSRPTAGGVRLTARIPPLLKAAAVGHHGQNSWIPLPVLSLSPHQVSRWARSLMRADPSGCDALLIPAAELAREVFAASEEEPAAGEPDTVDAFLRLASPQAVRLAVLCSMFEEVPLSLLYLIQQTLVPEAGVSEVAEVINGRLFEVAGTGDDRSEEIVLTARNNIRSRLTPLLSRSDLWHVHDALSSHISTHAEQLAGFRAVVSDTASPHAVPAGAQPFAEASDQTLRLLGMAQPPELPSGASRSPSGPATQVIERAPLLEPAPSSGRGGTSGTEAPYFFLSYARSPAISRNRESDDRLMLFHEQLSTHIIELTGFDVQHAPGFFDRRMEVRQDWELILKENLATCRVFVPVYTTRYFTREWCGKEWDAISRRQRRHRETTSHVADSIVPVLWTPPATLNLPPVAQAVQYGHPNLGRDYLENGLYGLLSAGRHAQYRRAVWQIAETIVAVARKTRLQPCDISLFHGLENVFLNNPDEEHREGN
ncbi:TIR-like protein FxsC [Streptomyces scabiei]|uniref:TIR-like protein FxsC n=1 Tax=Streptomyces scabiei TaxID=1930 RepID=UPI00227722E3|nr:TIR-like protein FxsC [Streptomyces scabiei]